MTFTGKDKSNNCISPLQNCTAELPSHRDCERSPTVIFSNARCTKADLILALKDQMTESSSHSFVNGQTESSLSEDAVSYFSFDPVWNNTSSLSDTDAACTARTSSPATKSSVDNDVSTKATSGRSRGRLRSTECQVPYVKEPDCITCCFILRQQLDECQSYDFSKIVCDMSPEEFKAVCNLSPLTSLDFFSFLPHATKSNTAGSRSKKTEKAYLILDLDETLLFTSTTPIPSADAEVIVNVPADIANPVPLKATSKGKKGTAEHYSATKDYARSVNSYRLFIKYRPHLEKFLTFCAKYFELVIFTASRFYYCGAILRQMEKDFPAFQFVTPEADTVALSDASVHAGEPRKHYVTVLHRDHCTPTHAGFVKDLNLLGCNLERTVLIDNNPICGAFQPYNLVSIKNFELLPNAPENNNNNNNNNNTHELSELEKEKGFVAAHDNKSSVAEFLNDNVLQELAQRGSLLYNLAKCDDVRAYCIRTMEYNMKNNAAALKS